ncbi:MAG: hypothetical protein CME06_08955 [Gemmatimonadetes bacterium]|nr:hypothetical protein [Gemmatimonadota bacterium]
MTATNRTSARICTLMATLAPLVLGCGLESPQAPSWDASYAIPLFGHDWEAAELLQELDSLVVYDPADPASLGLEIDLDLDPISLAEALIAGSTSDTSSYGILDLDLDVPFDAAPVSFRFSDLASQLEAQPGPFSGKVDTFAFHATVTLEDVIDHEFVHVAEGSVTVSIHNGLPVEVFEAGLPDSDRRLQLRTPDGELLAQTTIDAPILPDQTHLAELDMGSSTLSRDLVVVVDGTSPGSGETSVWIDPDATVEATVSLGIEIVADAMLGEPESVVQVFESAFPLDDHIRIESAEILEGSLDINYDNGFAMGVEVDISIPTYLRDGTPLSQSTWVDATTNSSLSLDLSGARIVPDAGAQELRVIATVRTEDRRGNPVEIDAADRFDIGVVQSDLELARVTGVISTPFEIEPEEVETDLAASDFGFKFASPRGTIVFDGPLPADLDLDLALSAPSGGPALHVRGLVPAQGGNIELDSDELAAFLDVAPPVVIRSGEVRFGDGITPISLDSSDEIAAGLLISTPFELSLDGFSDTLSVERIDDIDEEIREMVLDRVQQATIALRIENSIPLGMGIEIRIDSDSSAVLDDPALIIPGDGSMSVDAAAVDEEGRPLGPEVTVTRIEIQRQDIEALFMDKAFFLSPILSVPGSNGDVVSIYGTDAVDMIAHLEFTARIGDID